MKLHFNVSKLKERIAVSVFFFISGFTFSTWASRIPEIQSGLKLNDAELGSMLILLPAGVIITMPFAAILLSKFTSRKIMLIASLLYVLLLNLLGLSNNVWEIGGILFLFGASRNLFNISINTQAVGIQNLIIKPILASFHGIWSIAGLAGAGVASILISLDVKLITHFNMVSLVSLILILLSYQFTFQEEAPKNTAQKGILFPDRALMKLGFIAFFGMVCEATMSEWGVIYFVKVVHAPKAFITIGYIAYLSSMTVGRFIGDKLTNLYGPTKHLKIAAILVFIGVSIALLCPNLAVSVVGYFIIGFGLSCIMPLVFSLAGKNSKLEAGPAITSISTVSYLGFLTGPPLIGYISYLINIRVAFILILLSATAIYLLSSKVKS
jgi:MFS family permease